MIEYKQEEVDFIAASQIHLYEKLFRISQVMEQLFICKNNHESL